MTEYKSPESALRTHAPHLEQWAINQMPKAGWKDLRLCQYNGTDLYQWFGKRKMHADDRSGYVHYSVFEDPCGEPFVIRRR